MGCDASVQGRSRRVLIMSERENRVITTLDPAEYHGLERLSSGGVKQMLRSPAHYRQWKDTPTIPSPAMQFGSAVHCMVLEPHKVEQVIAVMPDDAPDKRSNSGKAWHAEFALNCAGKVVLSAEDNARAERTARAIIESPGFRIIGAGNFETSLLWRDPHSNVLCKARPDFFASDGAICVDLKTCTDASREAFKRQLWNLRYDIQAAFYLEGMFAGLGVLPHSFVWAVVETELPHGVAWYRIGHGALEIARADITNAMFAYAECVASDRWPSYAADIQEISLPPWARARTGNGTQPQEF